MKLSWMILPWLICGIWVSAVVEREPDRVVQTLYDQVVARHPLGIPKGPDKAAIWPLLSKGLRQKLDAAQACEADYIRQHQAGAEKPELRWIESGLFSGANEKALPAQAVIERTEPQNDGSFRVYVRLTYKESPKTYGRPPDPGNTFNWNIAADVISEGSRFVTDDILFFKDDSADLQSRLSKAFVGCDGSRWSGR